MITDDMIRANLERIEAKRARETLLGFPVIERDFMGEELTRRFHESFARASENDIELRDAIARAVEVSRKLPEGTLTVTGTFKIPRELLEDAQFSLSSLVAAQLEAVASGIDLEILAREWGLIDDEDARRIEAEENQRSIDASRAELREILKNGRQ